MEATSIFVGRLKKSYTFVIICKGFPLALLCSNFLVDNEMALRNGWTTKGVIPCYQPGPLTEILTTANLRHAASRIWNCAEGFVEWSFSSVITITSLRHIFLPTNSESTVYQYFSPMDRVLFKDSSNKNRSTLWSLFYCLYCWVWTGIWLLIDNTLMVMYVRCIRGNKCIPKASNKYTEKRCVQTMSKVNN